MSSTPIQQYNAEDARRGILHHVAPVLGYPGVIAGHGGLIWNFFRRELLGRFRGSFLGIFWVLLQPIFLFAIFFLVFGIIFGHPRAPTSDPSVWFAIYLFSGILAFSSFSEATVRSCGVVVENGNLVKKVAFPCELLPVSQVMVSTMVYIVGAVLVIVVGAFTDIVHLGPDFLAWPLLVVVQAVMALGLGLFLACLNVFMRDAMHLYSIFSQAWFFLSPVFWTPNMLKSPDKLTADYYWVFEWNPLYPLMIAHRQALGIPILGDNGPDGPTFGMDHGVWHHLGLSAAWAAIFLVVGYAVFHSRKNKFADLV